MIDLPPLPDEETQHLLQFLYVCPVGLMAFQDDGTIDRINPAAINLLVSVSELADDRNAFHMLHLIWPELEQVVGQAAGRVGPMASDHRVRSAPGRPERWLSLSVLCVAANSNMLTVSDVTAAVVAEQQLVEAHRRHAFLLEVSDALRELHDPEQIGETFVSMLGRQLGAHKAYYARLGDGADHLVVEAAYTAPGRAGPVPGNRFGISLPAPGPAGDAPTIAIDDVAADERIGAGNRDLVLAMGCGSLLLAPLFSDGYPAKLLAVADDGPRAWSHHELTLVAEVADRLWSAEAQATADRDNEARLASIIDTAAECIIVTDGDGVIQLANRATTATFGYRPEELIGRNAALLVAAFDPAGESGDAPGRGPAGTSSIIGVGREVEGVRRDGAAVPLELAVNEWCDSQGERFFTAILRDTTQRREQAEALARARKLEVAGQLAGGVAHDLNNLLTVIGGNLELAEERIADSGTHTLLSRALDAVRRGVTFNNRLLSLVLDRPRTVRPLVLSARLADLAPMVQHLIGPDMSLAVSVAPDLWPVSVDSGEFDSALLNLASNGRDAMTAGGTLTIEVRNVTWGSADMADGGAAPGDYVVLSVTDTGTGMTPEVAQRATDPFFTTKPVGRGSGLGLASVAGFAHGSGGGLVIDSEPLRGTTVRLYLPREGESAAPVDRLNRDHPAAGGGQRILVVDDDELVRETTAHVVEALGYDIVTAGDGAEAIGRLREDSDIELVLTDVVMPGVSGRDLARWIEANRPDVGVVLCSGYDSAWSDAGGGQRWPHLQKPYTRHQLGLTLAALLGPDPWPADPAETG